MIGGNVNEFIDTLSTGQELTFLYKNQKCLFKVVVKTQSGQ